MDRLDDLVNRSIYIIREAYAAHRRMAALWSVGKDSTAMVWLMRHALPPSAALPVVHIDTSYKFREIYEFRDRLAKAWGLNLVVVRNEAALAAGMNCARKFDCCTALKTGALRAAIERWGWEALLVGIRRDEHGVRAKERYFSPREADFRWDYAAQPMELWDQQHTPAATGRHWRVHPLLHWTELDVWNLIGREKIPTVDLYFARDGRRYRSIGCECCCEAVESRAADVPAVIEELMTTRLAERAGRAQDKEQAQAMQRLRALGYM